MDEGTVLSNVISVIYRLAFQAHHHLLRLALKAQGSSDNEEELMMKVLPRGAVDNVMLLRNRRMSIHKLIRQRT